MGALAAVPRLEGKSKKKKKNTCVFVFAEIHPETLERMVALFNIPGAISGNLCYINMFFLVLCKIKSLLCRQAASFSCSQETETPPGKGWLGSFIVPGQSC